MTRGGDVLDHLSQKHFINTAYPEKGSNTSSCILHILPGVFCKGKLTSGMWWEEYGLEPVGSIRQQTAAQYKGSENQN